MIRKVFAEWNEFAQAYVVDALCTAIYDVLGSTAKENSLKSGSSRG